MHDGRMRKRLTKLGSSLALVLDRPLIKRLGIDETTDLDLDVKGGSLVVTPRIPVTQEDWYEALKARAHQILLAIIHENSAVASPDVAADLENFQRLVTEVLGEIDLPEHADPSIVANETTFRPGKTCQRSIAEQFIVRTISAIRIAQERDAAR